MLTIEEQIYAAKFVRVDGITSISYGLGRDVRTLRKALAEMVADGRFNEYRKMTLDEWEAVKHDF